MTVTLPLEKMTVAEKLELIETIWKDLRRHEDEIESPEWHSEILEERERRIASGEATFMELDAAMAEVRKRCHEG